MYHSDPLHKGASAPLVKNTNSADINLDPLTGEVLDSVVVYDRFDTLSDRFKLQRIAAAFLGDSQSNSGKSFRVSKCVYTRIAPEVTLVLSPAGTASYKGIMYCGSVWACPVCSAKISHYRKTELESGLDTFYKGGGFTYLLTLTVPHKRNMPLSDVLGESKGSVGILRAFNRFTADRPFRKFRDTSGYVGMIRALEVTYGLNGWHPHLHILVFSTGLISTSHKKDLFSSWVTCCLKSGLRSPTAKRGLDLKRAFSPAEYLTKFGYDTHWGSSSEMTKTHSKKGKKSLTAFDFLRSDSPEKTKPLFIEYAKNFFGKRQLLYTKGLKALLSVSDLDDQTIASGDLAHSTAIHHLTSDDWKKIISNDKQHNTRATVLKLAETGGVTAVVRYLQSF